MCSHEVWASNTRSRGASRMRVITISRSVGVVTVSCLLPLAAISVLLSSVLELLQVLLEPVIALFPETAVRLHPVRDFLERPRLEPGRAPLALPASGDQSGTFENLEVLRNGRQAHRERLGQLGDRSLASGETRQDPPAPRARERPERPIELLRCHRH